MASTKVVTDHNPVFQLKGGLYTLSSLQLLKTKLTDFEQQLDSKIQQAPKFFHNAPIVIDLIKIGRPGSLVDFQALKELLLSRKLIPIGVKGGNSEQHAAAIAAGLPVLADGHREREEQNNKELQAQNKHQANTEAFSETTKKTIKKEQNPAEISESFAAEDIRGSNTRVITEPVRSGQQIYARGGDLLVLAPVSHGAELLADGHIYVYGPLRGRALAGVTGDNQAHILCQSLEAELISIAGQYKISEDIEAAAWKVATDVSLVEGRLHIRLL